MLTTEPEASHTTLSQLANVRAYYNKSLSGPRLGLALE